MKNRQHCNTVQGKITRVDRNNVASESSGAKKGRKEGRKTKDRRSKRGKCGEERNRKRDGCSALRRASNRVERYTPLVSDLSNGIRINAIRYIVSV